MSKTRVEHVVGRYALRTIQSDTDDQMYVTVTDAAIYMATAGFLTEANQLLTRLWSYGRSHSRNTWLPDRALAVLWQTAGSRPADIPFALEPIDQIEMAHRLYMAVDQWSAPLPTNPWQELEGTDLLRRGLMLAYPATSTWPLPSREHEVAALAVLEKYLIDQGARLGWMDARAACLAAELAARNSLLEQAGRLAVRWAEAYPLWWLSGIFVCMACNRHVAPLLLRGILATPLGLNEDSCRSYLEALLAAVDARMQHGRALVYGTWPWPRLLAAIGRRAIKAEPDLYTQEERRSRSITRPPASGEAINAAQVWLDRQLPADYVEFLAVSNGLSPTSPTSPGLLPVENIIYLRHSIEPESFAIYRGYPDDIPAALERCILVSDKADEMVLLVPPLAADRAWETWFFANWVPGEVRYPSFRHYLEQELQDLAADT